MDYTYDFGTQIKEERKKKKYTQEKLANAINVTYASISKYESNAITPSLEVMCRISSVLGVSMDKLCGLEKKEKLSLYGLNDEQAQLIRDLIELIKNQNMSIKSKLSDEQYKMLGRLVVCLINK